MSILPDMDSWGLCPSEDTIATYTDDYFLNTARIVGCEGDSWVTYALFVRRPCLMAVKMAVEWLEAVAAHQDFSLVISTPYEEGDAVGAGDPLLYISGPLSKLSPLETIFLQWIGPVCVAAMNARDAVMACPDVPFIAMDARHNAGRDMQLMMGYAAFIGSQAAKRANPDAAGFIGSSSALVSRRFFGRGEGMGTMPHAYIGYVKAGLAAKGVTDSAAVLVEAARLYRLHCPDKPFIVLPDFDGHEISDALAVCRAFPEEAASGVLTFRLDTHGGRYMEGLDKTESYAVLERHAPDYIRGYHAQDVLDILYGEGVSAAAIWHFRDALDAAGFPHVKIAGTSGFNTLKCHVMKEAGVPLDMIGTGSFLPENWKETYSTADIICYDGCFTVKAGREHLIAAYQARYGDSQPMPAPQAQEQHKKA